MVAVGGGDIGVDGRVEVGGGSCGVDVDGGGGGRGVGRRSAFQILLRIFKTSAAFKKKNFFIFSSKFC